LPNPASMPKTPRSRSVVSTSCAVPAAVNHPRCDRTRRSRYGDEHSTQTRFIDVAMALTYRTEVVNEIEVSYVRCGHAIAALCQTPMLVSSRTEVTLTRAELLAILEHARTHVRWHHATVLRLATVSAACLPGVSGAQALGRALNRVRAAACSTAGDQQAKALRRQTSWPPRNLSA
jgi:hypothetical protein